MDEKRSLNSPEYYGIFEIYQEALNSRVLHGLLLIAIIIEFLQMYLGSYLSKPGFYQSQTAGSVSVYGFSAVLLYLILMLIIYHRYDVFPDLIDITALGFILFHQIHTFVQNTNSTISLIFWIMISLLVAWQYVGPSVSVSVIATSYFIFIIIMYYNDINITNYLPLVWVMLATIPIALALSIYRYRNVQRTYNDRTSMLQHNTEVSYKLRVDALTGLSTGYAFNEYIEQYGLISESKASVVVMDLDDLQVCNNLYGRDVGDQYIQTFSNIVKFMVKDKKDIIAYTGNGSFIGVLASQVDVDRLERRLDRYNHLLREAFDQYMSEGKFFPHFSFGIGEAESLQEFQEILSDAERSMYVAKAINKKDLFHNNYLQPEINYISLFNESNITVVVWKALEGWPLAYATENIQGLLGYSKSDLLGNDRLFLEFVHPDDIGRVSSDVKAHISNMDEHFEQTYRLLKEDGQFIWVRDYSVPVWKSGELIQINGYIYNIDLEMEAKSLLDEQYKRFSDTIEATKVGTWEWDISTGHIGINQRFADILGYGLEALKPMTYDRRQALINNEDLAIFNQNINAHLEGKTTDYEMEYRLRHKKGHWVWVLDRGRIMKWTDSNEPWIMIGAISEITEIKKTEALLRQSEKLNALGRMAGGIAHDMNNQLMMMRSFLDMVEEKNTLEAYQENYAMMDRIVTRTTDTIKQLMTFTRHRIFEPKIIDMVMVMDEVVRLADRTFQKNLRIQTSFNVEGAMIYGDMSLIENALINLCLNAKDAMEPGGELILGIEKYKSVGPLHTSTGNLPEGDYVVVEVSDNGSGIDEVHLEKVFEPFFTTKKKGEGIGLSTVVSVVKEHGGGLEVHSKKGVGTTFILYFPELHDLEMAKQVETKVSRVVSRKNLPSVMVVDDEPVLSQVMSEFLAEKGCEVMPFTDPVKAVAFYENHWRDIDVVLLDMLMPNMTGSEVFDAICKVNSDVRVLFLSGYSHGMEVKESNKANVIGFMEKPVKLGAVYRKIIDTEL